MDKHIIGENAGILWRFLSTDAHKRWLLAEVKKGTGLTIWNWPVRPVGWHVKIKSSLSYNSQVERIK